MPLGQEGHFSGPVILHGPRVYIMFGGPTPAPTADDDFSTVPRPAMQALVEGKWARCKWNMTSGLTSPTGFHGFASWTIPEKTSELRFQWQGLHRDQIFIFGALAGWSHLESTDNGFVSPVAHWKNELFATVIRAASLRVERQSTPIIEGQVAERWEECKLLAKKEDFSDSSRIDFMHGEALPGATAFRVAGLESK